MSDAPPSSSSDAPPSSSAPSSSSGGGKGYTKKKVKKSAAERDAAADADIAHIVKTSRVQSSLNKATQRPPPVAGDPGFKDYLNTEYAHPPGQNYTVLAFLNPEQGVQRREEFLFAEFVKWSGFSEPMKRYSAFTSFLAAKHGLRQNEIDTDFEEFVEAEKMMLNEYNVSAAFKSYTARNRDSLEAKYVAKFGRETSARGLLVLGTFATEKEAISFRVDRNQLTRNTPLLVAEVGRWLPCNPINELKANYLEPELNDTMRSVEEKAELMALDFEKRKHSLIKRRMDDNLDSAAKTGAVLTQWMDDEGKLHKTFADPTVDDAALDAALAAVSITPPLSVIPPAEC